MHMTRILFIIATILAITQIANAQSNNLPPLGCTGPESYAPASEVAWLADSRTANAITGDIKFSKERVVFGNGITAQLRYIGNWQLPAELRHVGGDEKVEICATLYAFEPPFAERLLQGTPLCGHNIQIGPAENAGYLVAYILPPTKPDYPGFQIPNPRLALLAFNHGIDLTKYSPKTTGILCGGYGYRPSTP